MEKKSIKKFILVSLLGKKYRILSREEYLAFLSFKEDLKKD